MNCIDQKITKNYALYNGDSCELIRGLSDDSIGYSIFSPPFSSLYTYSNSDRDMGNCKDDDEFFEHMTFLASELHRVLMPGRLLSFHCMLLPSSKQHHGDIGLRDFRGDLIRMFQKAGFIFHSEVVIWKDPVTAMQRTKALGLLHKTVKKDGAMSRQGIPDYLVTMRKRGENLVPIVRPNGFENWIGEKDAFKQTGNLSIDIWQRYASPVWMDIDPSKTLQSMADENDERHICPLQLQVIERGIELWSAPGDIVLTPFMGIGSETYCARKMARGAIGFELKPAYYQQAIKNMDRADREVAECNDVLFSGDEKISA